MTAQPERPLVRSPFSPLELRLPSPTWPKQLRNGRIGPAEASFAERVARDAPLVLRPTRTVRGREQAVCAYACVLSAQRALPPRLRDHESKGLTAEVPALLESETQSCGATAIWVLASPVRIRDRLGNRCPRRISRYRRADISKPRVRVRCSPPWIAPRPCSRKTAGEG